eukprot:410184-Pleurochrysis_carterae.AAC.1
MPREGSERVPSQRVPSLPWIRTEHGPAHPPRRSEVDSGLLRRSESLAVERPSGRHCRTV